jgi:hypothetical protein
MSNKFTEWYLTNKVYVDTLLESPEFIATLAKCGIVQSFYTKKFCKKIDICETDDYQTDLVRIPTNKELDNFFQTVYHAGTVGQFFEYAKYPSNLDTLVHSGFHYLFDVFKKGIFVVIKNGNIVTYLPFSNSNYTNDWGQNLKTTKGGFNTVLEIEEKNHYVPKFIPNAYHTMIQKNPNKWYANYCIFRNTIYKNGNLRQKDDEGDKSIVNFLELLTTLCYSRNIPDVCFFISPRDFPVLRKDRYHPYDRLYLPNKPPNLSSFEINKIPIFSQSITDEYADLLIPNDDDIIGMLCDSKREMYTTNWDSKKNIAVFRGSATGCGTTSENNPRLKLYELAKGSKIMDVKIISLNEKIKVDEKGYVRIIDKTKYPRMNKEYKEEHSLSPKEQAKFKYIIHVQGHVAAFRLTRELAYGSLILKVYTNWKTWYSDQLIGWKVTDNSLEGRKLRDSAHYLIIDSDLSNLVATLKWCTENKRNDDICKSIAQRSLAFYKEHFSNKEYMLDYMRNILTNYSVEQSGSDSDSDSNQSIYKGLVVIPFRDNLDNTRQKQLDQLLPFLEQNDLEYRVIVQTDLKLFNRGLLLNEGIATFNNFDYYIFHDADLIPDQILLQYYLKYPKNPIHIGHKGQRWSGPSNKFIGGIFSINKHDFYKINGFPNDFWGWGGEDDAMSERLRINKIVIERPHAGSVTDLEALTIKQKLSILKETGQKNMIKQEQLEIDKTNWFNNGIKQIDLVNSSKIHSPNNHFVELFF